LGRIDEEVRKAVWSHVVERRHQRSGAEPVSCHSRVADCNAVSFHRCRERQFEGIEYESASRIDLACPDMIEPAPPFRVAGPGMEQFDLRKVGNGSQ
jgi:hypothetical protein